jgi:hypothetical protein
VQKKRRIADDEKVIGERVAYNLEQEGSAVRKALKMIQER